MAEKAGKTADPADLGVVYSKIKKNMEEELLGIMDTAGIPRKEKLELIKEFRRNFKAKAAKLDKPQVVITATDMARMQEAINKARNIKGGQTRDSFARVLATIIKSEVERKGKEAEEKALAGLGGFLMKHISHINDVKVGTAIGAIPRGAPRNLRRYVGDDDVTEGEKVTPLSDLKGE